MFHIVVLTEVLKRIWTVYRRSLLPGIQSIKMQVLNEDYALMVSFNFDTNSSTSIPCTMHASSKLSNW